MASSNPFVRSFDSNYNAHFVIDGMRFESAHRVYVAAIARGFEGCEDTILRRLRCGCTTWAELTKKPAPSGSRKGKGERSRAECAMMLADIDARKAQIASETA